MRCYQVFRLWRHQQETVNQAWKLSWNQNIMNNLEMGIIFHSSSDPRLTRMQFAESSVSRVSSNRLASSAGSRQEVRRQLDHRGVTGHRSGDILVSWITSDFKLRANFGPAFSRKKMQKMTGIVAYYRHYLNQGSTFDIANDTASQH